MTVEPMVRAEQVRKSYGRVEALRGVDLEVMPGQVCCLAGPSGSGKSSFLRCPTACTELRSCADCREPFAHLKEV